MLSSRQIETHPGWTTCFRRCPRECICRWRRRMWPSPDARPCRRRRCSQKFQGGCRRRRARRKIELRARESPPERAICCRTVASQHPIALLHSFVRQLPEAFGYVQQRAAIVIPGFPVVAFDALVRRLAVFADRAVIAVKLGIQLILS